MSPAEAGVLQAKEGGATNNWIKSKYIKMNNEIRTSDMLIPKNPEVQT